MFSKKHSPRDTGVYLVLDIRSSSIGIGVVKIQKNQKPVIVYSDRVYLFFEENQNPANFVKSFMTKLDNTLSTFADEIVDKLYRNGLPNISKAFISYSSPWYISKTKEILIKKDKPFTLTKELFQSIVNKENGDDKNLNSKLVVIEKDATDIFVNGYRLDDPFGKKVDELRVSFFTGVISKDTHSTIESKISSKLNIDTFVHRTHPFILFSTLRNMHLNMNDFCFFDVGGEITDFGLVNNSILTETVGIPTGKHNFIRKISSGCKFDKHTSLSMLELIASGKNDSRCDTNTTDILKEIEEDWYESINNSTIKFIPTKVLPDNIFLISDDEITNFVHHLFSMNNSNYKLFQNQKRKNIMLNCQAFEKFIKDDTEYKKDTYMYLITTFLGGIINRVE